ncbi:MAG: response regulator transcription factor [Lachnospiraceae bacterium]
MRLLLAEDEKELSRALVTVLKHNNYSVDAVFNGQDALDYLETGVYDGAILDIMMPKMDGITVLKKIREQGSSVPIMMLTARSEIDDRVNGLDSGADDYLTKPFSTKELLARIRAMTRRQSSTTDSILTSGNIILDRTTYQLSSKNSGESYRLANKEFQMLEMLMVNPGQVISVDQFMDKIWGFDSDAELNVVWVYISYLRKKLSTLNATVTIKAARGLGYSLEVSDD